MSAKKKEIIWFGKNNNLNEIYQEIDMKFSFVNEIDGKLHQCHQWVKCRDFLHDAVRTTITGKKSSIYGFTFDIGENPLVDLENMNILVAYKDAKFWPLVRAQLSRGLRLINQIEANVGEELSVITKVQANKGSYYNHVWVIKGPKMWMSSPFLVSLYTFLIRLGAQKFKVGKCLEETIKNIDKYKVTAKECHDINYLNDTLKYIVSTVKCRKSFSFYNPDGISDTYYRALDINNFHNRAGIVSLCKCNTPFDNVNKAFGKLKAKTIEEEE